MPTTKTPTSFHATLFAFRLFNNMMRVQTHDGRELKRGWKYSNSYSVLNDYIRTHNHPFDHHIENARFNSYQWRLQSFFFTYFAFKFVIIFELIDQNWISIHLRAYWYFAQETRFFTWEFQIEMMENEVFDANFFWIFNISWIELKFFEAQCSAHR